MISFKFFKFIHFSKLSNKNLIKFLSANRLAHETNTLSVKVADYLLDNWKLVKKYNQEVIHSREFVKKELKKIKISSDGRYGNYLLIDMKDKSKNKKLVNFKEAIVFGFLGLLRFLDKKNIENSVTGATNSSSSGLILDNKIL